MTQPGQRFDDKRLTTAEKLSHLRVKLTSLGFESTQIRRQERKLLRHIGWNRRKDKSKGEISGHVERLDIAREALHLHRMKQVRSEARAVNLAYGFLRGKTYAEMEPRRYTWPFSEEGKRWDRVMFNVTQFAPNRADSRDLMQKLAEWIDVATKLGLCVGKGHHPHVRPWRSKEEYAAVKAQQMIDEDRGP